MEWMKKRQAVFSSNSPASIRSRVRIQTPIIFRAMLLIVPRRYQMCETPEHLCPGAFAIPTRALFEFSTPGSEREAKLQEQPVQ
jgi:hypothetical protein